jgi:hypothetical protein
MAKTTIYPKQTLAFSDIGNGNSGNLLFPAQFTLVEGMTYSVILNNTTYNNLICSYNGECFYIGDPAFLDGGTPSSPFVIAYSNKNDSTVNAIYSSFPVGDYSLEIYQAGEEAKDYGKLNFSVAFNPTSAFPLDARSYFTSLADAEKAAQSAGVIGSTDTVYYYGQKLLVVESGSAAWYTITPENSLQKDGTTTTGATAEVPHFDLYGMGLPSLTIGGSPVELATDTTEIMTALDNGAVKFTFNVNVGADVPINAVVNNISMGGAYICAYTFEFSGAVLQLMIEVSEGGIRAFAKDIFEETPVSTIDMSNFETSGTIVERYANGTTKTSTIEFDENGNPTKITDGDGNVTTFVW